MKRRRFIGALIAFAVGVLGCGHMPPVPGLDSDVTRWKPNLAPIEIAGKLQKSPVQSHIKALIDEARAVILSDAFRRHVQDYSDLRIGPFEKLSDGRTTLATYLGMDPTARPLPVWVLGFQDGGSSVALTGICPGKKFAEMRIGGLTIGRWLRSSTIAKSCAINTIAHELTHTIPLPGAGGGLAPLFTDRGYQWASFFGQEFVSYGLGSIAQCTYLEQHRTPGESSAGDVKFDFARCLRRYGTSRFTPTGCDRVSSDNQEPELDIAETTTDCIMTEPPQHTTGAIP